MFPAASGFVQETRSLRVVFGAGTTASVLSELDLLEARSPVLITTAGRAAEAVEVLEGAGVRFAGTFSEARVHVPSDVVERATAAVRSAGADVLLALGGGSAIGVAKAVALETGLPIVAVPTTYSGSEMTRVWGVTDADGKRTGREERVAPRTVIYDPVRTLGLPPHTSAHSGVNAIAHAVEALYAPDLGPVAGLMAEEGIRVMADALPRVIEAPDEEGARSDALYGAYLCGAALDQASMGLNHKLAHVLGGTFDLPHALVHAILLPHVANFNEAGAPGALARVARALEPGSTGSKRGHASEDRRAGEGLQALNHRLGIRESLRDLGLDRSDLRRAAEMAARSRYPNPRPAGEDEILGVLEAAWRGADGGRPTSSV